LSRCPLTDPREFDILLRAVLAVQAGKESDAIAIPPFEILELIILLGRAAAA